MKRSVALSAAGFGIAVVAFVCGRFYQDIRSGYHFEVEAESEYGSEADPVTWRSVFESVGWALIDTNTTIIEYRGRTIFKADRIFQENAPFAANIRVSGNRIEWDDGELQFRLVVEEIESAD